TGVQTCALPISHSPPPVICLQFAIGTPTLGHPVVACKQIGSEVRLVEPARSGCPINAAVEAFGDSWSLLVLRDVMFGNRRYFRPRLAGAEEGGASHILADRLKRLVTPGPLARA